MELRQLTYFKAIAEHGSINGAARALHMSQPPLSYAISQLEDELGVTLFVRSSKGIELTDAGRVFYQRAVDILGRSASAAREVSMIINKKTFRLGVTPTVVPVISPYLCQLEKENGNLMLELHGGDTYHLKEQLDDGSLDGAVIRTPVNLQGCRYHKIKEEPMAAVFGHRRKNNSVTLEELSKEPLIIYRRYEALIHGAFEKRHLEINMILECDDARTALQFVEDGLGTAIVPMTIAQKHAGLSIATIDAEELTTSILLAYHNTNAVLSSLLELLKK